MTLFRHVENLQVSLCKFGFFVMFLCCHYFQRILEGVSKSGQLTGGQCFVEAPGPLHLYSLSQRSQRSYNMETTNRYDRRTILFSGRSDHSDHMETSLYLNAISINLVPGYFAHIVQFKQSGIIAKNNRVEVTRSYFFN